jgi:hypothetical protein
MGTSEEDVISKAKGLLGSLIAASDRANWLVKDVFNYIKDIGVRYASRCLPQGVSLKISRAASVVRTSGVGSAILSFCSAHPAFIASLVIITAISSVTEKTRDFVGTLLKLFIIDLPLAAILSPFTICMFIFRTVVALVQIWREGGGPAGFFEKFLKLPLIPVGTPWAMYRAGCSLLGITAPASAQAQARANWSTAGIRWFVEDFCKFCKKIYSACFFPVSCFWNFLKWVCGCLWEHKGFIVSMVVSAGIGAGVSMKLVNS